MTGSAYLLRLLLLAVLASALVSCRTGGNDASPSLAVATPAVTTVAQGARPTTRTLYPLTVPSADGRSITVKRAPERVVSLSPTQTETLFALGAGDTVVGTDRFSDYPEAVKALPKIDYSNPNSEALVALQPDLVLVATRQKSLVSALEQVGLTVLLLEEPSTLSGVLERIRLMGRITDRLAPAEELTARMEERISAVRQRVSEAGAGPRVYHEIDPKLFAAGPASFVGDLYALLKAQNIVPSGTSRFPQLTAEAIIGADPEVIILGDGLFPGGTPDEVKRRPGWAVISAVRNDRVYAVDDNLVSRPGPRVVEGLEEVARLLYPDLFR